MQNILEELYFGNVSPAEVFFSDDDVMKAKTAELADAQTAFLSGLSSEKRKLYDVFESISGEMHDIEDVRRFSDAFRLGARLMLEVIA